MSIALTTGLAIAGVAAAGVGAGASIAASKSQANAAKNATAVQQSDQQAALAEQQREFNVNQTNQAPFLNAGQKAVTQLSDLVPQLNANEAGYANFTAPTAAEAEATPGYQFTLDQGSKALQNSAAARGNLLTGGTATALENYGQGLASTTYQQTYNNALQSYLQNYNKFQSTQADQYNRLAGLAGTGQTAANTLGAAGQAAANNTANIDLTSGAQQGQSIQNAGAATASGYVGAGNAINSGINGIGQTLLLSSLLNGGSPGSVGSLSNLNSSSGPLGLGWGTP